MAVQDDGAGHAIALEHPAQQGAQQLLCARQTADPLAKNQQFGLGLGWPVGQQRDHRAADLAQEFMQEFDHFFSLDVILAPPPWLRYHERVITEIHIGKTR